MLVGFKEQLRSLGVEIVVVEKRNDKSGNVDPRLISPFKSFMGFSPQEVRRWLARVRFLIEVK
jgi:hypothetical protein